MRLSSKTLLGTTIAGRYELIREIGAGGMGLVFEANDRVLGRSVAVKMLHDAKPDRVARLGREVKAMEAVRSPYVCTSIAAGIDSSTQISFHAMELLVGESLSELMSRTRAFRIRAVMCMAAHAAEGLGLAHAIGVIHRDIKPANLFLSRPEPSHTNASSVLKVLDFGLAKLAEESFFGAVGNAPKLTKPRSMIGSPRYMSPEQARGTNEVDRRTDIWSLGVVMYEMLTGMSPHGEASSVQDRILRVCVKEPADIRVAVPTVPADVAQIVMSAVTRNRDDRFASAPAMHEQIMEWLKGNSDLSASDFADPLL